jgi:1,2-diacylglycerol 3-alpha-glucosyltransferase
VRAKVVVACAGLGRVERGLESFAAECFDALSASPAIDAVLAKGAGEAGPREWVLPHIPRHTPLSKWITTATRKHELTAEQASFGIALHRRLKRVEPAVLFYTDWLVGVTVARLRRLTALRVRVVLSNGGPGPPPFERIDHVHQVSPNAYKEALAFGEPPDKHTLIPYGVAMTRDIRPMGESSRRALRTRLGLPEDEKIVISVAAIARTQKRMDALVRAIAVMDPRPHLCMLGHMTSESDAIVALATELLGEGGFTARSVAHDEVSSYLDAADCYALVSVQEGSPRAMIEAFSHGLPCVCNRSEISRFVVGDLGFMGDVSSRETLSRLIEQALKEAPDDPLRTRRARQARERFSWEALLPRYEDMLLAQYAQI